jgi:hypothetical protein
MATNYKWTIRFSILTPILVIIFLMGGGHGWYTPAMVLFPWATLNITWQDHLSKAVMMAGAFQFILYGFLIDKSRGTNNQNLVIAGILLTHIMLAILILVLRNSVWR